MKNIFCIAIIVFVLLPLGSLSAKSKKGLGLDDINVGLVVSIVGQPAPKQELQRQPNPSTKKAAGWVLVPTHDSPLPLKAGGSYQIKVEKILPDGNRVDITHDPYVRIHASEGKISERGVFQLKRTSANPGVPTAHLGLAHVWAEYVSPRGEIGYNGFSIDIQPCDALTCSTPKITTTQPKEISDLNVDIVVSVDNQPIPEQMIVPRKKDQNYNRTRGLNFRPKPLQYVAGSRLKLKVEAVSLDGKREDITNSKFLNISTTDYVLNLCNNRELCVWPKDESPDARSEPPTLRYGHGRVEVEYITPDGKIGFNGFAVDILPVHPSDTLPIVTPNKDGAAKAPPAQRPAGKELLPTAWKDLKTLHGIEVKAQPDDLIQLIIFFDPNCPVCADLWRRLYGKDSKQQQISSLWIPVTYMHETSLGKAVYLLNQRSRQALAQNFEAFDDQARQGNAPTAPVMPQSRQAIERNTAYWKKLYGATPLIVYRTPEQKTYLQIGLPKQPEFEALLKELPPPRLGAYRP